MAAWEVRLIVAWQHEPGNMPDAVLRMAVLF